MIKAIFQLMPAAILAAMSTAEASVEEYCSAIAPHLSNIEGELAAGTAEPSSIGLGETYCEYGPITADIFQNRFECVWKNTAEKTWTRDDALTIGQQLNANCPSMTANFGSSGRGEAYFLWYGNFTTVLIFVTDTGLRLTAQIDEEAYHWS